MGVGVVSGTRWMPRLAPAGGGALITALEELITALLLLLHLNGGCGPRGQLEHAVHVIRRRTSPTILGRCVVLGMRVVLGVCVVLGRCIALGRW